MATKTGWVRIGRSGETIDGRVIEPEWLTQAADNYDKEFFSAPVWPGHTTWYRLGTVHDLRAEANEEGGVDLYAIIEPNEYYRQAVKYGQRLHTSMELRPNFRNKGSWYLQGLAATDEPASVATSEMKFSANQEDHADAVFTSFVENQQHTFNEDQPPSWFKNIFKNKPDEDNAMASKEFEELKAQIQALTAKFETKAPETPPAETDSDGMEALTAKVDQLTDQVQALTATMANDDEPDGDTEMASFKADLKALSDKLELAMKEENGTTTPENTGGEKFEASEYQ